MADNYSKLKNAELEQLLKDRGLPHTGKKAEMVARLQEDDKTKSSGAASTSAQATSNTVPAEDQIDWDDDNKDGQNTAITGVTTTATSEPAAAAIAAGGTTRADNPISVPNQVSAVDPSTTNDLTTSIAPSTDAPSTSEAIKPPPANFSANLAATDIDAEIAKRKARAKKFGLNETDDETLQKLERAKRFGNGAASEPVALGRLDQALPEKRERGVKRSAADANGAASTGGADKKRKGGADGAKANGQTAAKAEAPKKSETPKPAVQQGQQKKAAGGTAGGAASWMSEADKAAAEKRKAKWATPTPAPATPAPEPASTS